MVKPTAAIDIIARDKSDPGFKSVERRAAGFAQRTSKVARDSGLGKLGKQLDGLTKFRTLNLGLDSTGRSLATIGSTAHAVNDNVSGMTRNFLTFGGAATGVLGRVAAGAGVALGAVAGLATVVGGLGVGAYMLGEKWAKLGAGVGRSARDFNMSAKDLQAARAAGARFGVDEGQVDASIEGLGSTLYDAKSGANNLALGALAQMKVQLKQDANGNTDVNAAMYDIADAIARQKDPMVQRKLAGIFGVSAMLPALRQGSGALKAEGSDYLSTGAAFTDAEIARSAQVEKSTVRLRQHLSALEKKAGVGSMEVTGRVADAGPDLMKAAPVATLQKGIGDLGRAGIEAGRRLVEGARRAAEKLGGPTAAAGFDAFRARIEHQESRGHQFHWSGPRKGRPLVSSAGAVGVMQVLPETGRRAAKRAGIPWDEKRFYNDEAYNRQIGTAELWRLYRKYDGHEVLAASAYNAGEGRLDGMWKGQGKSRRYVEGWLKKFGDPRKGEISDEAFAAKIPFDETQAYARNTARAGAAKAEVTITLKGAPDGTTSRVTGGPGVDVSMKVARSLMGAP